MKLALEDLDAVIGGVKLGGLATPVASSPGAPGPLGAPYGGFDPYGQYGQPQLDASHVFTPSFGNPLGGTAGGFVQAGAAPSADPNAFLGGANPLGFLPNGGALNIGAIVNGLTQGQGLGALAPLLGGLTGGQGLGALGPVINGLVGQFGAQFGPLINQLGGQLGSQLGSLNLGGNVASPTPPQSVG
ncbi:MAG: hypothetical protein IPG50_22520 [Myxococcales bacterium]|nr:hypothetical protein [Myxococcales bacterium]